MNVRIILLAMTMAAAPAMAAKAKPKGKGKGKPPPVEVVPDKEKDKPTEVKAVDKTADEPSRPNGDPRARGGAVETAGGGPSRIEFDDRLVQGQTNKANAIYLFERRESALRSLLKKRSNFRDEIDERLYE
jgi:hypothetical protein